LLRRWIQQPLLELNQIHARLDAVEEFNTDAFLRQDVRQLLDGLYDVERLVGRIGFGNANARDLIGLKRALLRLPKIKARLQATAPLKPPRNGDGAGTLGLLRELEAQLDGLQDVADLIERAVVDDPPIFIREGGIIKSGYEPLLDELREGAARGKNWLTELEAREKKRTGIKNLRVRYNEVFGFFIEVPRSLAHLIPHEYERRATISHAERYVTPELKSQEAHILATEDRVKDLEYDLFVQVRREVARHTVRLQTAARILAQLDALSALAEAAARYGYVKPVVDDGDVIEIREGRHAVVERFLREGDTFVPNDARLDDTQRVIILTGPNMSGKSVFIRQCALIVLMAQMGSFVPARFARIGIVDRIFTRVGASDDIAQGRSTFLVEMSETSHILHHATPRSLIVLDEVGRGTSTYDGISLAWAIAEEIHNVVGAKTLFATHYHELTQLESAPSIVAHGAAVKNYTMAIRERGGASAPDAAKVPTDAAQRDETPEVIFLRQVVPGGAEKSFGIHVARLAGLPARVVTRAEQVLSGLEDSRVPNQVWASSVVRRQSSVSSEPLEDEGRTTDDQRWQKAENSDPSAVEGGGEYTLAVIEQALAREGRELYDPRIEMWRAVLRELAEVDIANLTPLQALNLLNEIQLRVKASESS
jgi:DNA mismatch repair protein MutS